jgi:hypothetical protein
LTSFHFAVQSTWGCRLRASIFSESHFTRVLQAQFHPSFDVRFDPQGEVVERFKVQGMPTSMIIDRHGVVRITHIGFRPVDQAVDRAYDLLAARRSAPFLINFGGDLRANRSPSHGPWQVGIERPDTDRTETMILDLEHGALATSGDSRRYLLKDGVRYGHILDPRTGWPVWHAPRSVTVAASSCTEAGLLSTLALLHGARAREYLEEQGVRYWLLQ